MSFTEFAKIARLSRPCVITEKIDGTNAQVCIIPDSEIGLCGLNESHVIADDRLGQRRMFAGSRTRYITPADDNFGFAAWVKAHADELWALGPGRHFGEWWGSGIQRGYGLPKGERRWSLFNTSKWSDDAVRPSCCHVVPVLYSGVFDVASAWNAIDKLAMDGSVASPGFMKPEGIVIYHVAGNLYFKKTIEKDDEPKSRGSR